MTVAMVTPRYAPAIGGVERHVEAIAHGLLKRNIGVEVITTDPTRQLPPVEERDGILVRRFPTVANDGVYFVSPELGFWLGKHIERFDVLHAHNYHAAVTIHAALANRRHGVPLILTPHYHGTGSTFFRNLLHLPYRAFGNWVLKQAQQIICVSSAEEKLLHQHFGQLPTSVIPNGIEVEALSQAEAYPKAEGRVIVLAVGRMEAYKQIYKLITALPHLPPEYEAVIIGTGVMFEALQRLADDLGVSGRLRLLGQVSQQELLSWYRTADVLVSMSLHESFGLTILEAAAAGATIVASDIPAHLETACYLADDQIALVPSDSEANALAQAIQQAGRRGHVSGSVCSSLPTWNSVSEAVLACYQTILDTSVPHHRLAQERMSYAGNANSTTNRRSHVSR